MVEVVNTKDNPSRKSKTQPCGWNVIANVYCYETFNVATVAQRLLATLAHALRLVYRIEMEPFTLLIDHK